MLKKVLGFILLIAMALSVVSTGFVCLAEDANLVQDVDFLFNGHMEWLNTSYSCWSGSHFPETENVHGGKNALKLTSTEALTEAEQGNERRLYLQDISGLVPGQTYTISGWFYTEDLIKGNFQPEVYAGMKIEIHSSTGSTAASQLLKIFLPDTDSWQYGEWTYGETTIKCPEGVPGTATIHVRHDGIGTVLYDDLAVTGPTTQAKADYIANKKATYQEGYDRAIAFVTEKENYTKNATLATDAVNFVDNPGFETASNYYDSTKEEFFKEPGVPDSGAVKWSRSNYGRNQGSSPNEIVSRTNEEAHKGNYSMKIIVPEDFSVTGSHPYVLQTISTTNKGETYIGGAEYILSSWIKTKDVSYGSGVFYKIQANYDGGNYVYSNDSVRVYDADEWTELKYVFTMPENITSIYIYIRLYGTGTFYCDDVSFGRSDNKDPLDFYSDHTFYYTDDDSIDATANIKTNIFDIEDGSDVTFTITDYTGTTIDTKTVDAKTTNSVTFPISALANPKTAYILKAEYTDPSGKVLSSHSKRIYRYDRPTALNKSNNYVDPVTGKEMYPFFMYMERSKTYNNHANLAAAGFTVIRTDLSLNNDADIQLKLDDAYSRGMKVLIGLYSTLPAGHPKQIERTRHIVSTFCTHPAIAAWMLMDEPSVHIEEGEVLTYDEMLYYLEEGYKAIRDIDPVHPIYNIETVGTHADSYERTSQMCDIFAIDPYPSSLKASIGGSLEAATQRAINAVYGERPVWVLGLAASWSGSYGTPINSAMLRYQLYDSLWAGAKGAGHYLSDNPNYSNPTFTEIYLTTFNQAKACGEIDEIFDHFSLENSEVFNEGAGNGYQWRAWCKDNGDMFLAVRSKLSDSGTVLDKVTATFELVSSDGKTSIDGFNATLVNGISEQTVTSLTNKFICTITKGEISLYKLKKGYTLSNLEASSTDTSVTVEYDVANNFTDGGTVIYAFYDAQSRFIKMKTENAAFNGGTSHIQRTFDEKIDFASMKVYIWNSVTGMTPLSNMIEFINE